MLGKESFVEGSLNKDLYITIPKKATKDLKMFIEYVGPIKAPIKKNQEIGKLIIENSEEDTLTIPVYASKDIKKVNFFKSLFLSFNYMIWGDA